MISANMLNANIQASVIEKVWTVFGPEFVSDDSKTSVNLNPCLA